MKVWIACFTILFVLAELGLWIKSFLLPLPIYVLGGAFLAIASHSERRFKLGEEAIAKLPMASALKSAQNQPTISVASVNKVEASAKPQ